MKKFSNICRILNGAETTLQLDNWGSPQTNQPIKVRILNHYNFRLLPEQTATEISIDVDLSILIGRTDQVAGDTTNPY